MARLPRSRRRRRASTSSVVVFRLVALIDQEALPSGAVTPCESHRVVMELQFHTFRYKLRYTLLPVGTGASGALAVGIDSRQDVPKERPHSVGLCAAIADV